MPTTVIRVISGGQEGADQGGLWGAEDARVPTGGWATLNYRTETGLNPGLLRDRFKLREYGTTNYAARTYANVRDSDGTAIFGNLSSPGSKATITACRMHKKPWIENPTVETLRTWIADHGILILNVAGNRESRNPGIEARVRQIVREALQ